MCYTTLLVNYLVDRRCVIEQNETEATRSTGVRICLNCVVVNGAKLFKICPEILCIYTKHHMSNIELDHDAYTSPNSSSFS